MTTAGDLPELGRRRFHEVGGVRLHAVEAGEGPLVVLLHGFPDFWYCWRRQVPALVRAGYRVVAPDLRGCNEADKPRPVSAYRMEHLVDDVAGLIGGCGATRATVVGHDWGGAIAWALAARRPDLVNDLVILNAPHPARFLAEVRTNPRQLARSWYMVFFQLPWLPEALMRAADFRALRRGLARAAVNPTAFTDDDLACYVQAFSRPGAPRGAINYYRALGRDFRAIRQSTGPRSVVDARTLVIWGDRDGFLVPELAEAGRYAPNARVEHLADAGHWVQLDQPERVNRLLLAFLEPP